MNEQDKQLFEEAMQGVKPLKHDKIPLKPSAQSPKPHSPKPSYLHHRTVEDAFVSEPDRFPPWQLSEPKRLLQDNDPVFHAKNGVQPRLLKQLKRGTYPMTLKLDLHGYTRQQADAALHNMISLAQQQSIRGVKVITGKGQRGATHAILKSHVTYWMEQDNRILAFCTAIPTDGGRGALYVLIRRR